MTSWQQVASNLIHKWEGCRLKAYPDPATGGAPWSLGFGATGPGINQDTVWTQEQADADLANRISHIGSVIDGFGVSLSDNQKGALVSLAYNIGLGALSNSTLIRLLKAGDLVGASNQFLVWNRANGRVMTGLVNRRQDEQRVFNTVGD